MGTLSHLFPSGQQPPRRKGSRSALTAEEARHLRASLRNLRVAFGSYACLADAMGVSLPGLMHVVDGRKRGSGTLAWKAAKASGIPVEKLLTGALTEAGRCPLCRRKG